MWQKDHARRYMEAVYGKDVWFRAPETFNNMLERWLYAVAIDEESYADTQMSGIEHKALSLRESSVE